VYKAKSEARNRTLRSDSLLAPSASVI
jgi:hypothetical protein